MIMRPHDLNHGHVLAAAKEDQDAVIKLTRALVRIPTRAGIDSYDPIVEVLSHWMRQHGLGTSMLRDDTGAAVGLTTEMLRVARTFGVDVEAKIAGPSNIGNYLAGLGIPATAGFGVTYAGLHATDEHIQLNTILTTQAVYHATLLSLLKYAEAGGGSGGLGGGTADAGG